MHLYAHIDIPAGNVGEFVTEYFSENGQHNRIIGELSINGSVQFIGISDIWGSVLPFIPNPRAPDISSGWGSNVSSSSNGNTGSSNINGSWGGSFSNPTFNLSGNWSVSIDASPADLSRSPTCPHVYRRRIRKYLLHPRRQQHLWRQFNRGNPWVRLRRENTDFSDDPASQ